MADQLAELRTAEGGIAITRVFDAPRELVWKEWTEPERFADWFGGSEAEVPSASVSLDLVPGGAWTATTLAWGPERADTRWEGKYVEIKEPERLAFTIRALPGAERPDLVTIVLTELGDGSTQMLFQQQGWRTATQYERTRANWSTEFDHMATRLAR